MMRVMQETWCGLHVEYGGKKKKHWIKWIYVHTVNTGLKLLEMLALYLYVYRISICEHRPERSIKESFTLFCVEHAWTDFSD